MSGYLIDTNVLSEYNRSGRPDTVVGYDFPRPGLASTRLRITGAIRLARTFQL